MPLPKLETPLYELVVPSSKKKVKYRPFLVKEEKILLIAQESNDANQMFSTIIDIIQECTFQEVSSKDMTSYDLEFIFLKLREVSIGEEITFKVKCGDEDCGHFTEVTDTLSNATISYEERPNNVVQLDDKVGVKLKDPNVSDILSAVEGDNSEIALFIESIFTDDKVHAASDIDPGELKEFIESMSHKQMDLLQPWVTSQPEVTLTIEFTCGECGKKQSKTLRGIASFLD